MKVSIAEMSIVECSIMNLQPARKKKYRKDKHTFNNKFKKHSIRSIGSVSSICHACRLDMSSHAAFGERKENYA